MSVAEISIKDAPDFFLKIGVFIYIQLTQCCALLENLQGSSEPPMWSLKKKATTDFREPGYGIADA